MFWLLKYTKLDYFVRHWEYSNFHFEVSTGLFRRGTGSFDTLLSKPRDTVSFW